jgi:carbamoyltransferase
VFQIREEKRASSLPSRIWTDPARLQTVSSSTNPRYYRLIENFCKLTGIPMVLNTSFNENEPVVCNPQEALDCFLRTKMDALAIGDTIISRSPTA